MLEAMHLDLLNCDLLLQFGLGKTGVGSCLFKGAWQKLGRKSCACRDVSQPGAAGCQAWKGVCPCQCPLLGLIAEHI